MADEIFPPTSNFGQGHLVGGLSSAEDGQQIVLRVNPATGRLLVDAAVSISGLADATADGAVVNVATTGNLVLGTDGSNYQVLSTDSSGKLLLGAGTLAIGKLAANSGVDIGDVDILSIAAGDANIGNVDIVTLPAGNLGMQLMAASLSVVPASNITDATYIGDIKFGESLPAGTAAIGKLAANSGVDIGDVDILSIAAGDNNIGNVDIVTVPADPFGATADAAVVAGATGSISAKLRSISRDLVANIVLAAGTNAIGKLAANSGVDIGDVDILSVVPGVGATNLGKAVDSAKGATDTGVMMLAIRDDTLSVYSNAENDFEPLHLTAAGRLYTSATIDAALPAGTNGIGKLTANSGVDIGDVDVLTLPAITIAATQTLATVTTVGAVTSITNALPAGTNAIGKLAANSGVDIGDVDILSIVPGTGATNLGKAEDAAHSSGDVGVMTLAVRDDDPVASTSDTAGDYSPLHLDGRGVLWTRSIPDDTDLANLGGTHTKKYYTSTGAATDGIIWSPAAGKRWFVTDIFLQTSADATVTIEDDLAGGDSPIWKAELKAGSGWSHSFKTPWFSGEDAADLIITTSAGNIYVMVTGYEI